MKSVVCLLVAFSVLSFGCSKPVAVAKVEAAAPIVEPQPATEKPKPTFKLSVDEIRERTKANLIDAKETDGGMTWSLGRGNLVISIKGIEANQITEVTFGDGSTDTQVSVRRILIASAISDVFNDKALFADVDKWLTDNPTPPNKTRIGQLGFESSISNGIIIVRVIPVE